jgi:hypothetical protein
MTMRKLDERSFDDDMLNADDVDALAIDPREMDFFLTPLFPPFVPSSFNNKKQSRVKPSLSKSNRPTPSTT